MKRIVLISLLIFPVYNLSGQDFAQNVAIEICNCIDTIENADSLDSKLNRCAPEALESVLESSSDEVQEAYATEEAMVDAINKAFERLMSDCPKIRKFVVEERVARFYRMSQSEAANEFYTKGNELYEKEDIKGAARFYAKAVKKDPEFIYAIDNLALSFRKMGDTKKAIKYYTRSLEIYPEGSFALQNLGVACTFSKEYDKALDLYQQLTYFYPEKPEGYFGIGKVFVIMEEYEKAIDFVFIAHKIYTLDNSEFVKDTEELAVTIYNKLKEQNKQDIFIGKAKEYGININ